LGADYFAQMVPGKTSLKKILYISYDGMTDPLGQSQVLPYLTGLAKAGYRFTIVSFEKKDRFEKNKDLITKITTDAGIQWEPLSFTTKPPLLSKLYDMLRMRRKVFSLQKKESFDMVHCRGYITADLGLILKRKFGVKFFFDMRGFWADEKKDGGAWDQKSFLFRQVYKYYKQKETQYISEADCIISLTEAGKKEIMKWEGYNATIPLPVIPCCADMDLFSVVSGEQKKKSRSLLGIENGKLVLSYLGSVGAWYMLEEMLLLFRQLKKKYADAVFLFVTHSDPSIIISKVKELGLNEKDIIITEASRQQVPEYIKASDINVSFIKPVYSKLSSSPTKLGEVLAMGIPVIANSGVGDVEEVIRQSGGGAIIHHFNEMEYEKVVEKIPKLRAAHPLEIRNNISGIYDLNHGIEMYKQAYSQVFS
jgi:glycosyltransferase involved in cell wall biosynthesis